MRARLNPASVLIWIGIATAWVACLGVMVALVARAPIMDEDSDLVERAERIAEREAWLKKSRKRGAALPKAHE